MILGQYYLHYASISQCYQIVCCQTVLAQLAKQLHVNVLIAQMGGLESTLVHRRHFIVEFQKAEQEILAKEEAVKLEKLRQEKMKREEEEKQSRKKV